MTTTEQAPDTAPSTEPDHMVWRSDQRVLTGTAAGLAEGWGIDPAWVRMAFTVLVLYRGLGLFAYALAWALLPKSHRAARPGGARLAVAAAAGVLVLVALGDRWTGSPWSVIVVLAGAAAALWRGPVMRASTRPHPAAWAPPPAPPPGPLDGGSAARVPRPRRARVVRPPSVVGRLSLAAALAVVAVVGVAGNGRPGPMAVAFGIAAAVCGVGMVIAGFGQRARYLVVPAVLALGASTVAASIDGLGVRFGVVGDWVSYGAGPSSPLVGRIDRRAGTVQIDLTGATVDAATVVRVGTGDVDVLLDPDRPVRLDLRARVGIGTIDVIGQRRSAGYRPVLTTAVGPADGSPVVRIDAAVGVGSIDVFYVYRPRDIEQPPAIATLPPLPAGVVAIEPDGTQRYARGIRRRLDGTVTLPDGTELRADGTRRYSAGAEVLPDGSVRLADGTTIELDGTIVLADGVIVRPPAVPAIEGKGG